MSARVVPVWPLLVALVFAGALGGCIGAPEPTPDAAAVDAAAPLFDPTRFEGNLPCGVGLPQGSLAPCLGDNVFPLGVGPELKTLLLALVWEPRTDLAGELFLAVETWGYGDATPRPDMHRYWAGQVRPGDVVRIDNGTMDPPDHDWDAIAEPLSLQLRVFPARDVPPSVVVDQRFDLHVLRVYGVRAPSDATPIAA